MGNLKLVQNQMVIDTREVADMMGLEHWEILRKLEGTNSGKGIIPILGDNNFVVTDYFIESTYTTGQNKTHKCYLCTKMGCEF